MDEEIVVINVGGGLLETLIEGQILTKEEFLERTLIDMPMYVGKAIDYDNVTGDLTLKLIPWPMN